MRLETALRGAIDNATAAPPPASVGEAARAFGGTRGLAEALGVEQRTIQRYIKAERGEGGQARPQGRAKALDRIRELATERTSTAAKERLREGVTVEFEGEANGSGERGRVRSFSFDIPAGDELDQLLDAAEGHHWGLAAGVFEDALALNYAELEIGDVDALAFTY